MKIYIMTDLEGIAGVRRESECIPEKPEFAQACRYLEKEVNAAIAGAFDGGAKEVLVCDSHHGGFNFNFANLDPRARLCENNGIIKLMAEIDSTYDGYFNIGHHAKAGTMHAFLEHTQCSSTFDYTINGVSYGEIGQQLLLAGDYGVPQLMISGDLKACEESEAIYPGSLAVVTKEAFARNKVNCIHPDVSALKIRETCKASMKLIGKLKPFKIKGPYDIRLTFTQTSYADKIVCSKPFLERIDGRTVRYLTDDVKNILVPF
jgi:D-amino peptidase